MCSAADADAAFGNWLAGFIDGEGHFGIKQTRRTNGLTYGCRFILELRADDATVLDQSRAFLGHGQVTTRTRPGYNALTKWSVHDAAGCLALVELLDRFPLRAKKARDYAIWREAVIHWAGAMRQPRGRRDWARLAALKKQLAQGRAFEQVPVQGGEREQDQLQLVAGLEIAAV